VPALVYVWTEFSPVPDWPSPKFHEYVNPLLSESVASATHVVVASAPSSTTPPGGPQPTDDTFGA
jgi:hypothetical protein